MLVVLSIKLLETGRLREWVMDFRAQAEEDVSGGVPPTFRFADVLLR